MKTPAFFRLRIRNAADSADALVLSSDPGDTNPYIVEPPQGDGESIDPISGAPTTGSYSVVVQDPETSANTRPVTAMLADALARQQLLMRKAWIEQSANGSSWSTLVVGYITRIGLVTAIEFEFAIGQSRRIEKSRTVFKEATEQFPGVTAVIGGPVIGGFISDDFLEDNGGWTMEVDEDTATHTKLALVLGFDPRKPEDGTFTSTSTAIADYTNDWARGYVQSTELYAASGILAYFPGLRARLTPTAGGDTITLVPLARPASGSTGPWYNPGPAGNSDKLTGFGTSQLYLPKVDVNGDPFDPAIGTEYFVYVYAQAVSSSNPLHIYEHPVDLWEKMRVEAGIAYDASVLPALKALLGDSLRLALRVTTPLKMSDADQKIIYGPFRLSSRIEDGEEVLFSTDVTSNAIPTTTLTIADLRSEGQNGPSGSPFDLDEGSIVTAITVKHQRIIKWTTTETDQPDIDALISRDGYPQSIENSDDDIPAGSENEQVIGDIPGMIWDDVAGPYDMEVFLRVRGYEMFGRFGRGAIVCESHHLPGVDEKVGEEVLLDYIHLPVSVVGSSPVTQRGQAPMAFQIVHRTETPSGPELKLVNSLAGEIADSVLPTFTLDASVIDDTQFAAVEITNADDLAADDLNVRIDYSVAAVEPDSGSGTHYDTITAAEMVNPTYSFELGPLAQSSMVWVQMRAELPGLRAGPYTAWQSIELNDGAQLVTPGLGELLATGYSPSIPYQVMAGADRIVVGADTVIVL